MERRLICITAHNESSSPLLMIISFPGSLPPVRSTVRGIRTGTNGIPKVFLDIIMNIIMFIMTGKSIML